MIEHMTANKLFDSLSDEQLHLIKDHAQMINVKIGEQILQEGTFNDSLYIIVSGGVDVFLPANNSRITPVNLDRLKQGEIFGEYSFVDPNKSSASIKASTNTELLKFNKASLDKIIAENSCIGTVIYKNILQVLVSRLRKSNKELDLDFFVTN